MNKENDYFLELMSNPTFSPKDFQLVGLNSENTGIQDASIYKKARIVQENPLFQTNGKFDESKFNLAYEQALYQYNDLARLTQNTKPFFRDDIFAPDTLKGEKDKPEFSITKVQNPLRQQESFVSFGTKEAQTQSIREIAQSNPTYDYKTNKWLDSPNETWWDNFKNPKVLAQWDFDADENGNPTNNPNEVVYHKGEKKIDPTTGTFYYETLGGRDIYGREVLSGFDTLTVDGSTANKYDFFDSDGIDKSITGSMARAVAQIAPVFVPYVGEVYVGTRILLSLSELIPTIGKIFSGSDNEFLSRIEGINKALSFSSSDYTQGSQEAGIEANPVSVETGLKLISDVFTQLAEQRWLFKYGTALFSGVNPKIIGESDKAVAARKALIESNAKKMGFNLEKLKVAKSSKELLEDGVTEQAVNFERAKLALESQLKRGQQWAKHLSMAYMTGITTASSYGEAKQQGASDTEASLFALGYTLGEYALLSSDLGQWILPELKLEKLQNRNIAVTLSKITNGSKSLTSDQNVSTWKKIVDYGKQLATQDYSDSVLKSASKMTISSMLSEGIEETSEELLLDVAKTLFNLSNSLRGDETKFDDNWENMAVRYGMSFIGGNIGGGIATALPGYRAAKTGKNLNSSDAYHQLVHIVAQGKSQEFINTVNKLDLGSKDLSMNIVENSDGTTSYKPAENYEDSQDYAIKQSLIKQVKMIEDILDSEGAKLSTDSLLNDKLIRRELKYHSLLQSNILGIYTNDFHNTIARLAEVDQEINTLERAQSGNNPDENDTENRKDKREFSDADKKKLSELKKEQSNLREKLNKYKDGSMGSEFIKEALFEIDTNISSAYGPTDFRRWLFDQTGKHLEELSESEISNYQEKWKEASINRREIVHRAYQVFKKNQAALSDLIKKHEEDYFADKRETILKNLEALFLGTEFSFEKEIPNVGIEGQLIHDPNISESAQDFLPIGTRMKIWETLLKDLEYVLDENVYNKFKKDFDNLSIGYNESLNIDKLPKTVEEFNNLNPETKQILIDDLGQGEEFEPTSDQDLMNAIKKREQEYNSQKAEEFLTNWSVFISNQQVQDELIKHLQNTRYLTPTTKQYLKDFVNRADIMDSGKQKINEAIDKVSNSPVEELLSNMVSVLQDNGIDTTGMITDLATFMNDLANSGNIKEFNYSPEIDLKLRRTLDLIDIAHAHIEAAKTEIYGHLGNLFGYNATVNELQEKYPIKGEKQEKLVELSAFTANSLLHELAKIYNDLKFYQSLFASNTNAKLTDHVKTELKLNSLYYGNLKRFSVEIPDDWNGKEEVVKAINDATTLQGIISDKKESLTKEERIESAKERLNIEKSVYNLFQNNKDKDLKEIFKSFNLLSSDQTLLNSETTHQSDRDFIWYLASIAANDPILISNEFKETIGNTGYAPVIAQEEAVKRVYSYLINPQMFEQFAKAYNEAYKEQLTNLRIKNGDSHTDFDTAEYLLSTRHFLIEGIPGAGKTTAVYSMLYNMLISNHPELLQKVWFVSNSKENAEQSSKYMKNVTVMSKEEYFRRIGIGYKEDYNLDENGQVKISNDDVIEDENGINHYKNVTINEGIEAPTLIFFDEVSSFSQQDLLLSEDFLKFKNIYSIAAGDFDQIGVQGTFKDSKDQDVYVKLSPSNFISSWKLGTSIRSNNVYKAKDISVVRERIKEFPEILKGIASNLDPNPFKFSYYESSDGIFGDKVLNQEDTESWKQSIKLMLDTLKEKEVLNVIADDVSTPLYQYLKSLSELNEYKGKISFLDTKTSQGQEGQYYVIELTSSFNKALSYSQENEEFSTNFGKTIYTAISRAKQGSLLVGDYSNGGTQLFQSERQDTLQINNLSQEVIQSFGSVRKSILESALGEVTSKTKLNREVKTIQEELSIDENPSGDDITEEDVMISNQDKPNSITNTEEGKLNIMAHSFLCQETGCEVIDGVEPTDPNTTLVLGKFYQERIDNLNGLAQIEKRSGGKINLSDVEVDSNGKIVKGKDSLLFKLNRIRNLACYEKDKAKLTRTIQAVLGATNVPIKIDFVYKNQFRDYNNESETVKWFENHPRYRKFYKGVTEFLAGIFNKNNSNLDIRKPKDQVIEIIVSLEDGTQLLEVPLCKMTSPLTLLNVSGFEGIKQIYDNVGQDNAKFKKEIKRLLQDNSSIPHLREYAMLLETYQGSAFNTIYYFDNDFTLASFAKVTGITTVSHDKGADYFKTLNYYYDGEWVPLVDYKNRMPWRTITSIFTSVEGDRNVVDINGHTVEVGKPFVLVSDYYQLSDKQMLQEYINQCKNNSTPLIRLVYVTPPSATLEEYIFNLNNALTKNKNNFENVDKDLGTKVTAFRLLQFALADKSRFREAFTNWINNSPQTNKESSINRMEAISTLVSKLTNYEKSNGRNKLYELLNTPLRSVPREFQETLKYQEGESEKWIMSTSTDLTLRHVLQQELHKMLLSELFYGDSIQSKMMQKQNNSIVFPEVVRDKVNAFIQDATSHNWKGVQYHLKTKRRGNTQNDYTHNIEGFRFAEIDTDYGSEYSVSGKPIQINGKLDSTSFILDAVPMLSQIIKEGMGRDLENISLEDDTNIFAKGNERLKHKHLEEHYLDQKIKKEQNTLDKEFADLLKELSFARGTIKDNKSKLNESFKNLSEEQKQNVLQDPRQFIYETTGLLSKIVNNKLEIVKNLNDVQDVYFLNDNVIFRRALDLSKVYTLTDQKEIIPITQEQFLNMIQGLKPNSTLITLSETFKGNNPPEQVNFNVQESLNKIFEIFQNIGIITETDFEKIQKDRIFYLTNPKRVAHKSLSLIYTKNVNTGKYEFTQNGPAIAALFSLIGNKEYRNLLDNPENHNLFNQALDTLIKSDPDFITFIENQIKEQSGDICSFKTKF